MSSIQSGTYAIDPTHSNVEFSVKHMMITTVKGRFGDVKGTLYIPDAGSPAVDVTIATASIEELIAELKEKLTILIVTHNMQQAARVSDFTAFMHLGELVEFGDTNTIFTNPTNKRTEDYITGRYG